MGRKQSGVSLMALIIGLVILAMLALLLMRLLPSFLEFRSAKTAIEGIARNPASSPADIRRAFDARAQIDDIQAIKSSDLEITKEGNAVVIGFAYRKEVPLFANVGMYIDYAARAGGQ
jgi:hypothetical protein